MSKFRKALPKADRIALHFQIGSRAHLSLDVLHGRVKRDIEHAY
jgi:hypothetical protein